MGADSGRILGLLKARMESGGRLKKKRIIDCDNGGFRKALTNVFTSSKLRRIGATVENE